MNIIRFTRKHPVCFCTAAATALAVMTAAAIPTFVTPAMAAAKHLKNRNASPERKTIRHYHPGKPILAGGAT